MRRIFNENAHEELKALFETGLYTKTQLALRYECSVTTVCLWLNPNEQAREDKFRSRTGRVTCECGKEQIRHARCRLCRIQTHSAEETKKLPEFYKYGKQTKHKDLCDQCYEAHKTKTITLTGFYKLGDTYAEYKIVLNPYTREIKI